MLRRLFRRRPHAGAHTPCVPPGTRVYAVGDIHGALAVLVRMVGRIREERGAERRVLVFLGDYVDRGLDSRGVINFLVDDPAPGFETVFLKGNHDAWLLAFLDDPEAGPQWLGAGGQATLLSYGVSAAAGPRDTAYFERLREAFTQALPPSHRTFLEGLARWHVEGDFAFVHAGIRPGVALEDQREEDLLWIRDEFLHDGRDHGRVVVHGHTLTQHPEVRPNRIGIDTGAYATDRLTCLVLEGTSRRFLAA